MFDENNTQLNEEIQQTEQTETPQQAEQTTSAPEKEMNWRLIRERAEMAERRLAQLEYERSLEKQKTVQREEPVEDFDLDDDSYIDGKQLKKLIQLQNKQKEQSRQEMAKEVQKLKNEVALSTLKVHYKDFSDVVNEESVEQIAKEEPELYESIALNPDVYKRGASLYNLIRKTKVSTQQSYVQKPKETPSAPRSAAGVGTTPSQSPLIKFASTDRRILSEEEKAAVRKRVEDLKARSY